MHSTPRPVPFILAFFVVGCSSEIPPTSGAPSTGNNTPMPLVDSGAPATGSSSSGGTSGGPVTGSSSSGGGPAAAVDAGDGATPEGDTGTTPDASPGAP